MLNVRLGWTKILLVNKVLVNWTTNSAHTLPHLRGCSPLRDAWLNLLDILSHQTGVAWADALYLQPNNNILLSKEEYIRTFNYLPIVKPTRSTFIYNNHACIIAGLILGKL